VAKLYFRYGTVGSGKTLSLVNIALSYQAQGKSLFLIKPAIDTRFGRLAIRSRTGLEVTCDCAAVSAADIPVFAEHEVDLILVDEAQFFASEVIDCLRAITLEADIPVICFGLKTDFQTHLFSGSARLLEIADSLEELKSICCYCSKKALFNLRLCDGVPAFDGQVVELGADDRYRSICARHYNQFRQEYLSDKRIPVSQVMMPCSERMEPSRPEPRT
jgi:thymidine kinase